MEENNTAIASPRELITQMKIYRDQHRPQDFFQVLNQMDQNNFLDDPKVSERVRLAGKDNGIYGYLINFMEQKDNEGDREGVSDSIRWASELGLRDPKLYPKSAAHLDRLEEKFGLKPEKKGFSRRKLLGGAAAIGVAAVGLGVKAAISSDIYNSEPQAPLPESPVEEVNNFNELIKPIIDEAHKRRSEWTKSDPDFYNRVDKELNTDLVNIALPAWSEGRGESLTVISYNLVTGKATSISCTRETITPEAISFNKKAHPGRQDFYSLGFGTNMYLYGTGGFDLVRKVIEDETGLSADFIVYANDMAIHDFIKDVAGDNIGIEIKDKLRLQDAEFDKRWGFSPNGFELDPGPHRMTAKEAMRYILSSDYELKPGKGNQPPGRKKDIISAAFHEVAKKFKHNVKDTIRDAVFFFGKQRLSGNVNTDFNMLEMGRIMTALVQKIPAVSSGETPFDLPGFEEDDIMINDEFFGDGGLIRVHRFFDEYGEPSEEYYKYAHPNMRKIIDKTSQIIKQLRAEGISIDDTEQQELVKRGGLPMWGQVPMWGDPEATNLAKDYWGSTRELVKSKLSD